MARRRWDRPDDPDHVLLLADRHHVHRAAIVPHLEALPARARDGAAGRAPRFRIVPALDGAAALERAGPEVTVAAVDLVLPRLAGLEVIQALRARRADSTILAFTAVAPPSEAVAAIMAGADAFLEWREDTAPEAFADALELAVDWRRLTRLIARSEEEIEAARGRLAQLSGELDRVLPALHAGPSAEDVLPFREAARRYLAASGRLFEGDARGLARRLGVSYFALRRLLARYDVPFPRRRPRTAP